MASCGTTDAQAVESVTSGESKSAIAEVPSKTTASSPVDANVRNAVAAYTKGKSRIQFFAQDESLTDVVQYESGLKRLSKPMWVTAF